MKDFTKIVRVGRGDYGHVYVTIKYKDGGLSLTGVEGPCNAGRTLPLCWLECRTPCPGLDPPSAHLPRFPVCESALGALLSRAGYPRMPHRLSALYGPVIACLP